MKRVPCVVKAVVTRPSAKASKSPDFPELEGNAAIRAKTFLEILRKNHVAMAELLPLQLEVNKVLHKVYPTVPHKIINMALYYHTSSIGYLENIHKGYGRFTIDKQFVDNISDEDREKATTLLKQIKAKLFKQAMKSKTDARKMNQPRSGNVANPAYPPRDRPQPSVQYKGRRTY